MRLTIMYLVLGVVPFLLLAVGLVGLPFRGNLQRTAYAYYVVHLETDEQIAAALSNPEIDKITTIKSNSAFMRLRYHGTQHHPPCSLAKDWFMPWHADCKIDAKSDAKAFFDKHNIEVVSE